MQGVTIGHGTIIGTNALVTKDLAPYSIVGDNPANLIRKRFDDETIDLLLKLAWWDWPMDKLERHLPLIVSGDVFALRQCL